MILLHGILHVTIFEADSLSNSQNSAGARNFFGKYREGLCCGLRDAQEPSSIWKRRFTRRFSWIKRMSFCRPKLIEGLEGTVGLGKESGKVYATIDLDKARSGRTRVIEKEAPNPRWYESFRIYCAHRIADVIFTVKSDNLIGASLIGRAYLPAEVIVQGEEVDRWLEICDENRNPLEGGAKIHVKLQYFDVSRDPTSYWGKGLSAGLNYPGVPATFFPQQQGCMVTLYQDAHVLSDGSTTPRISLANGKSYEPQRCWEDIFNAISDARHFIYITGWSVNTMITLRRDPARRRLTQQQGGDDITLGELLRRKAGEGVRVLILVWDDRTSAEFVKKDGLMATHDQETADYFRGTDVHCVLCPRNPDKAASRVQDLEIDTLFTHHQKSLMVDSEPAVFPSQDGRRKRGRSSSRRRSIVSFVGGIDLCDGRYDTQQHSLFRTLNTVHKDDFHQPNFPGSSIKKGGPREPWHDIHCRLQGPVAWDVVYNFEQRWKKQGDGNDLLLPLREMADQIEPQATSTGAAGRDEWNVQLFRSIDGGAAADFPEAPEDAARAGLTSSKGHVMDRSIQDAYINAIRRAKNFIYIENQYFLGSSYGWKAANDIKVEDIEALHLIPKELSLKVVSKIEAGERFTVYIVVPMWPEGVPETASVQAILDWQRRTMEMMYTDITQALQDKGIRGVDARDYLSFFCLGNREVFQSGEYTPEEKVEPGSDYSRAQQARRFMIYVHAKMMIVDDEYIIIGSANINQRSMDGGRDTEIAMGAYQPYYTGDMARGQIYGFRLALWNEHLGVLDDAFLQPGSIECMRKVNTMASRNWELYELSNEAPYRDLPGHLLSYPIQVTSDGGITELPRVNFFPDTKARVLGAKSDYLPPILTT